MANPAWLEKGLRMPNLNDQVLKDKTSNGQDAASILQILPFGLVPQKFDSGNKYLLKFEQKNIYSSKDC